MKDILSVRVKALIQNENKELKKLYENDIKHKCMININDEFISINHEMPKGFCASAWMNIKEFVYILSIGGYDIYEGWMKNKRSCIISCNDGIRPLSFLIEVIN